MKKKRTKKLDKIQSDLTRTDQIQNLIEQGVPLQQIENELDYCDLVQQAENDRNRIPKLLNSCVAGLRRLMVILRVGNFIPFTPSDPAKTQSDESL